MSTSTLLISLFEQKAAIDREFFAALAGAPLSPENRHIAIRTLNHIHTVDRIFAAHLRGEPHGLKASNTVDTPTLEQLRAAVERVDGWYVDYVRALRPEQFEEVLSFRFTDGDAGRMSREEILAHVIHHGSHHRGNVGMLMKQIDQAPPRDLFTRYLHQHEPARRSI
ncbi:MULTISPECIES: DinB family protein [unclassified Roseateles]|uniref:DinB family protein n=1 Tax=unclassified Roseateles TaxID=2626991 RepID=UPI0006FCB5AA|nr:MULTISPECIES: DinB family protein [unclassified Roseateles]KQW46512.1 damage-inducible protein DinB [Pelomonas sp. Root405]KRA73563.1 damage-inducible protein DinB [Pelomonas sp. Root662]